MGTLGKTWRRKWDREVLRRILLSRRKIASNGCWLWLGAKDEAGYGLIRVDGHHRNVHRVACFVFKGDKRALLFGHTWYARHKCNNPPCFNPDHLRIGTPKQNVADSLRDGKRAENHRKFLNRKHFSCGHPITKENTYSYPYARWCRICKINESMERRAQRKG